MVVFQPQVDFSIEWRGYTIRTARGLDDLQEVQRLRYRCFQATWPNMPPEGIDEDEFDFFCEHLLIRDRDDRLIGTLRMNCRNDPNICYSSTEFDMGDFWSQPGVKLEMGRTCLDPEARAGFGLIALGHGLGKLVDETQAVMIFGCTSIESEDPVEIATLQRLFHSTGAASLTTIQPLAEHALADLQHAVPLEGDIVQSLEERLVPPLLKGYLRAGARIAPQPSHDPQFRCVDFFTVLDLTEQVPDFMARYAPNTLAKSRQGG